MPFGDTLFQRLRAARREELEELLPLLKLDPQKYKQATHEDLVSLLSREIRSAAGNSFRNVTRDEHDFAYKKLLVDVSRKLVKGKTFKVDGPESEDAIEDAIEEDAMVRFKERLAKMPEAERRQVQQEAEREMARRRVPVHVASGVSTFLGTGVLVGGLTYSMLASILFGSLWTSVFGFALRQLLLSWMLGGGPVGLIAGAAMAVAGPSYRKTIPVVLRLTAIRKNAEAEQAFGTPEGSHAP